MRWAEHVACVGERSGIYRVWWVSLKKRDQLEYLAGRWEGNIKMYLKYDRFRPEWRQVTSYNIGFLTAVCPMIRCC